MPIYEYKCAKCGADFEALVRSSEKPECPECRSTDVSRRMSAPSAHTSGSADTPCSADCGGHNHSCGCKGGCCCH